MSNLTFKARIRSFEDAAAFLGNRDRKILAYETVVRRRASETIAVEHHGSIIALFLADGAVALRNAGWHSRTTANRLSLLSPLPWLRFGITGGRTVVRDFRGDGKPVEYPLGDWVCIETKGRTVQIQGAPSDVNLTY